MYHDDSAGGWPGRVRAAAAARAERPLYYSVKHSSTPALLPVSLSCDESRAQCQPESEGDLTAGHGAASDRDREPGES